MLEGQYRGHDIVVRSKEVRHVVPSYYWFMSRDALPLVRFPIVPSPSAETDVHQFRLKLDS